LKDKIKNNQKPDLDLETFLDSKIKESQKINKKKMDEKLAE
jgi:hypothetical protein